VLQDRVVPIQLLPSAGRDLCRKVCPRGNPWPARGLSLPQAALRQAAARRPGIFLDAETIDKLSSQAKETLQLLDAAS